MECTLCLLTEEDTEFEMVDGAYQCTECAALQREPLDRVAMGCDFDAYVSSLRKKGQGRPYDVLFALSGGKDSIAALHFTVEKYELRPLTFTVDHGFKNATILGNCQHVAERYGLDWFTLKVDSSVTQQIGTWAKNGELPCCNCNRLWKNRYFTKAVQISGLDDLFVGSDTLDSRGPVISRPEYGAGVIGLPLPLNVSTEAEIYGIADSLGWVNPQTVGWDTDCLAVGVALKRFRDAGHACHAEERRHLAHRVRHGLIEKDKAREALQAPMTPSAAVVEHFDNEY